MFKEDYILRDITRFIEELSNRITPIKSIEINAYSQNYFGKKIDELIEFSFDDLVIELKEDIVDLRIISELFYLKSKLETDKKLYLKSLQILKYVKKNSKVYDITIENKIINMEKKLIYWENIY